MITKNVNGGLQCLSISNLTKDHFIAVHHIKIMTIISMLRLLSSLCRIFVINIYQMRFNVIFLFSFIQEEIKWKISRSRKCNFSNFKKKRYKDYLDS